MVSQKVDSVEQKADELEAARVAADQAIRQAKTAADSAMASLSTLDRPRLLYLGALSAFVGMTLLFDMASFSVGVDYAVSETVAQAQRSLQARMNAWSYSLFASSFAGKLAWFSAVGGIGLVLWSAATKSRSGWIPLAEIACAGICALAVSLLLFVGFPDLSTYEDARCSATFLGYWMPLLATVTATVASVRRLYGSHALEA